MENGHEKDPPTHGTARCSKIAGILKAHNCFRQAATAFLILQMALWPEVCLCLFLFVAVVEAIQIVRTMVDLT